MWDYDSSRSRAAIVYYKGASWYEYDVIVSFSLAQVGKPYGLNKPITDKSEWYCSKLVYHAHLDAGKKMPIPGTIILPATIYYYDKMILEKRFDQGNAYNYKKAPGPR